jgi:cytochrome c oxidase subunit 3
MFPTFTHSSPETFLKEPGAGGRPPLDERPTGGGGGGGDDDWRPGRRNPRDLLHRARHSLLYFLCADVVVFAVLLVIAIENKGSIADAVGSFRLLHLPWILYINLAALMASSWTVEVARRNIFREMDALEEWLGLGHPALRRSQPWMAATLALGYVFLMGQGLVCEALGSESASGAGAEFFRLLSGAHAMHLVVGLVALTLCLTALNCLKRLELRQIAVDITAWYWQALNAIWVVALTMLVAGRG